MNDNAISQFYALCVQWEDDSRSDLRSQHEYLSVLRQLDSYSTLRYSDYAPYADVGPDFLSRLAKWITQVDDEQQRKAMLKFVVWMMYVDEREMRSLYRDAYRRVIVPWITPASASMKEHLSPQYELDIRVRLKEFQICSITESFQHKVFQNVNELSGMPKPTIFSERLADLPSLVRRSQNAEGLVVLEDIVGSGNQSARVLKAIVKHVPDGFPVLFAPLIVLEDSLRPGSQLSKLEGVAVRPTLVVPSSHCLTESPHSDEPDIFEEIRRVVNTTSQRVLERLNDLDEPPDNAFGFRGAGSLVVTHQNAPNNSLPLIHHKAPKWEPLFRRVHPSYGAPK